jgi:hypothetical protein
MDAAIDISPFDAIAVWVAIGVGALSCPDLQQRKEMLAFTDLQDDDIYH